MSKEPEQQQASAGEVPEWAWERLVELVQAEEELGHGLLVEPNRKFPTNLAFARYIAAHEPEPIDPLARVVERVACRLRQHGLYSDAQLADELEREVARARGVTLSATQPLPARR